MLRAFKKLKKDNIKLVFSGAKKNGFEEVVKVIKANHLEDQVEILGYVSDDDMLNFYQHTNCVIFASVCGPTNIPPIEAITMGKPLLCSNKYAMPEQCGDAALYFDPLNVDELQELMRQVLEDKEPCTKLKQNAKRRAKFFSVDKLAINLKSAIEAQK